MKRHMKNISKNDDVKPEKTSRDAAELEAAINPAMLRYLDSLDKVVEDSRRDRLRRN
jgi:uncharacterized protein (DUF1800 family)